MQPRIYLVQIAARKNFAASSLAIMMLLPAVLHAQSFTKITTGALVSDGGASRSVNWIDYDKDGWMDLFVSNGLRQGQNNFLYRNDGAPQFTFTKITGDAIVSDRGKSDGSSWGDYDNDGDLDCFVVNWYGDNNMLFENNGDGSFTRITAGALVNDGGLSETCSWGDYDNDGFLDLYVSNSGDTRSTGPQRNFLYHNNGDKTFTKITTGAIVTDAFYSRGVNWVDYDDDGDLDMFVANEENQRNNLYRNLLKESGAASFEKITAGALVTDAATSWSASWGDYDNDGDLDVFVANWGNQNNALYRNDGNGAFTKIASDIVVTDGGYSAGSGWGDYDNDGDLDLYVTNAYANVQLKNFLYSNQLTESGVATFEKIGIGDHVNELGWSYGFSWGDYDRDGALDIFVARTFNEAQNNALYRNSGNGRHWLLLNCNGNASNRSAIGAKVYAKAAVNGASIWQRRDIEGQSGYCGQNLQVHFGLGEARVVDSLKVVWPSGTIDFLRDLPIDTMLTLSESRASAVQEGAHAPAPREYELSQSFPNPLHARGTATIRYALSRREAVSLVVYDVLGRAVATLANHAHAAGKYQIAFQLPREIAPGLYFYRMTAGSFRATQKLLVVQ